MLLFQQPLGVPRFGMPPALSEEEPSRMGLPLTYFHLSLRPLDFARGRPLRPPHVKKGALWVLVRCWTPSGLR